MSFGTLYTRPFNPRSPAIIAIAKASNLSLEIVTVKSSKEPPEGYLSLNPLGKIPTFVGSDGYVLSEAIAIALFITSHDENNPLLGATKQDFASVVRWMSFANSEILASLGGWFNPLIGQRPFIKQDVEDSKAATLHKLQILDDHLAGGRRYLVGDRLSLADLFVAGIVAGAFRFFLDKTWRDDHAAVTGWFEHVHSQPIFADVAGPPVFAEQAMPIVPPTKLGPRIA